MKLIFPQKCSNNQKKVLIYQANKQLGRELYNNCLTSADVDYDTKNKLNTSICGLFAKQLIAEALENIPTAKEITIEANNNYAISLAQIINSLNKEQYAKLNSTAIKLQLEDDKKYNNAPLSPYVE